MYSILNVLMAPAVAKPALKTGVLVVDVQGDFTTWKNGSLAVAGTDEAFISDIQEAIETLSYRGYPIFATQDWHPQTHISFYSNHSGKKPYDIVEINGRTQVLWPPHCVQGSKNARLLIDERFFSAVIKKGKDEKYDSYSGFQDDGGDKTGLDILLKNNGIDRLVVFGIATDYCVKATAIDAIAAGYEVTVIENLCRGVAPETTVEAINEMKGKGIHIFKQLNEWDIKGT